MKRKQFIISFLMVGFMSLPCFAEESGRTLHDCYNLALKRSESIGIQKELIKETEGLMLQSLSTALPKVAFAYSQKWQDQGKQTIRGGYAPEAKFTLTQPLFTGFKEFAAVRASKHIGKQRAAELKRAEQLLFTDVSDAFYLYLSYQEDYEVLQKTRDTLIERVAELKKRELLGKSRLSDVASAESRLGRVEASLEGLKGQKDISGQLLEFLISQSVDRLVDDEALVWNVTPEELYSKVDQRPDVLAAKEAVEFYKQNVVSARSAFLPTVTLTGNSYTKRADLYEGNDWDATLNVNVPLFNGTTDIGALKQARAQANEADLRLSQAKRKALFEIRSAYVRWDVTGRSLIAFKKALDSSEKNYKLQVEDFQRSLVNNLNVLQALEDLQGVRSDYATAKSDAKRAYWNLRVTTGEISQ